MTLNTNFKNEKFYETFFETDILITFQNFRNQDTSF